MMFLKNIRTLIKLYKSNGKKYRKLNRTPIIIVGAPRSGTTLLLAILDAHPLIQSIPTETNILLTPRSFHWSHLNRIKKSLEVLSALPDKNLKVTADRWCEKTPKNIHHLDQIIKEFGKKGKIIHIVRDGRDVILSKHPLYPDQYFVKPEEWIDDVSKGLKWNMHPSVYLVRYEDIVLQFKTTIESLCNFLKLPVREEILQFHRHTTIRQFNSWEGQVRSLFKDSIGKRNYPENMKRIEELERFSEANQILQRLFPEN